MDVFIILTPLGLVILLYNYAIYKKSEKNVMMFHLMWVSVVLISAMVQSWSALNRLPHYGGSMDSLSVFIL